MTMLTRLSIVWIIAGVVAACGTEDPRGAIRDQYFQSDKPGGLGDLCGDAVDNPCASAFKCYEGVCTPTAIADACSAAPSCETGFCIARGEGADIITSCNCQSGLFDGTSCVGGYTGPDGDMLPFPTAQPPAIDESCPAEEIAPGVPDEATADCPAGSICTAESGGECVTPFVELAADLGDGPTAQVLVTGGDAADNAQFSCTRVYADGGEDGIASTGARVKATGALAESLIPGATEIQLTISDFAVESGGFMRVWPQNPNNPPMSDAGHASFKVTGTDLDFDSVATGGEISVGIASGTDGDEDGIFDSGTGLLGADFAVFFDGGTFATGSFAVECGDNDVK